MTVSYRLYSEDAMPAVRRLWVETAGWGDISEEMWRHFTIDAPAGALTLVLAEREGAGVVGQFAFLPMPVSVGGRTVKAVRPFAPILAASERGRHFSIDPMKHPTVEMYIYGLQQVREQGAELVYMLPDPRWMPFLRMMPTIQTGSFPLWSLPLAPPASVELPPGYEARPLETWGSEVDALWERFASLHPVQAVRDARMLAWRVGKGLHRVTAVRRRGELVGLAAAQRKGDQQWLVCEILAADADESLRATIIAATEVAQQEAIVDDRPRPIRKIAMLVTPVMEGAARAVGFQRDAYDFPLVVHALDPSFDPTTIAPSDWYVSPID